MKNLLFILFLLPTVVAVAPPGLQAPDWTKMPWAVPASEKEGHSWMVEYDHDDKGRLQSGIAIALVNNEVLFARYNPIVDTDAVEGCASFHTPRGSQTVCNNQFFLLYENFAQLIRVPVTAENFKKPCPEGTLPVEYKNFKLILDKPTGNRKVDESHRFIGTYFSTRDQVSYFRNTDGSPEVIHDFSISDYINVAGRFETLCRKKYEDIDITPQQKKMHSK